MAFCSNCGATLTGSFCTQCGSKTGTAAAGQAVPLPPPVPQPAPGTAPVRRKTSPIVWILVAFLGVILLFGIAVVGTGIFVARKAIHAGIDPDLMKRNPGLAMAKLITSMNPDTEIVKTDDNAGTVTIRDRRTSKVTTFSFDDIRNGRFNMQVQDDSGKTATVEVGGVGGKLPSWVPGYPGSTPKGTFSVTGTSDDGSGSGGNFTYTTPDPPSKVMSFYQDKAREMGMKANVNTTTDDGGMLIVADDDSRRTLTIVVGKGSPDTTVNVSYASKR